MAQESGQRTAAFVLSLLAGIWMVAVGVMMLGWRPGGFGMMGWMWGHGVMGVWWPWLGIIAGATVLTGAIMLNAKPDQAQTWGLVIVVASAVGLFVGMGGLLAGALGVVGGALAMSESF